MISFNCSQVVKTLCHITYGNIESFVFSLLWLAVIIIKVWLKLVSSYVWLWVEMGWHTLPCWIDLRHVGLVHIRISHDFIQNCMNQEELISDKKWSEDN